MLCLIAEVIPKLWKLPWCTHPREVLSSVEYSRLAELENVSPGQLLTQMSMSQPTGLPGAHNLLPGVEGRPLKYQPLGSQCPSDGLALHGPQLPGSQCCPHSVVGHPSDQLCDASTCLAQLACLHHPCRKNLGLGRACLVVPCCSPLNSSSKVNQVAQSTLSMCMCDMRCQLQQFWLRGIS